MSLSLSDCSPNVTINSLDRAKYSGQSGGPLISGLVFWSVGWSVGQWVGMLIGLLSSRLVCW